MSQSLKQFATIGAAVGTTSLAFFLLLDSAPQAVAGDPGAVTPVPTCLANAPITDCDIVTDKELFITDVCVVDDPCRTTWDTTVCAHASVGAWTFGKLMASVGGFSSIDEDPVALSNYVRDWLAHFQHDITVNGFPIPDRPDIDALIEKWECVSLASDPGSEITPQVTLNMRLAPFRLLAIVSRLDLRAGNASYGGGNAGEGRFIFEFLDINCASPDPDTWNPLLATVIFEYDLPADTCADVLEWAERWHALGSIPFGATYNRTLQEITDDFAGFMADPARINGSSLSQLRTNEIAFDLSSPAPVWEFREFQLRPPAVPYEPGPLVQTTVADTPDIGFDGTPTLAAYVTSDLFNIVMNQHDIPLTFNNQPFRAGSSFNPIDDIDDPTRLFRWDVPTYDCTDARHNVAIAACNGCHAPEAGLPDFDEFPPLEGRRFLQVLLRDVGEESLLSPFLTGFKYDNSTPNIVADPTCPPPGEPGAVTRQFNDIRRRALDLCDLLNTPCVTDSAEIETLIVGFENIGVHVH